MERLYCGEIIEYLLDNCTTADSNVLNLGCEPLTILQAVPLIKDILLVIFY
jgi:hypothetical protein